MRARFREQPDASRRVAEDDEILAEQPHALGRPVGRTELAGLHQREPVAAHQRAHRRAGAHARQELVVLGSHRGGIPVAGRSSRIPASAGRRTPGKRLLLPERPVAVVRVDAVGPHVPGLQVRDRPSERDGLRLHLRVQIEVDAAADGDPDRAADDHGPVPAHQKDRRVARACPPGPARSGRRRPAFPTRTRRRGSRRPGRRAPGMRSCGTSAAAGRSSRRTESGTACGSGRWLRRRPAPGRSPREGTARRSRRGWRHGRNCREGHTR